jgi:hypothetical protein
MTSSSELNMLCIYRVRKGKETEFRQLLEKHWPTLKAAGLATDVPAEVLWCEDKRGKTFFAEKFSWIDANAPGVAHNTPQVMAVWEPMGALCEGMEFMQTQPVPMPFENG